MSPESTTPRPSLQSAQCRTVPPSKCPPSRISVRPGPIGFVKEGLHWGFAETPAALMGSVFVVAPDPLDEILLQLDDRTVDAHAERHPVELVQHCFVEALDDSIGLRALGLGSGVVHVLDREIELVLVVLG